MRRYLFLLLVLSSEEIVNLITAIGTGVGEQFNIEKLRYGKIIIGFECVLLSSGCFAISFLNFCITLFPVLLPTAYEYHTPYLLRYQRS